MIGHCRWDPRHVSTQPLRLVSLVPSLSELLVAIGLREQLVGRTGFCIHPAEALRSIPKIGGTKDVNLDRLRALAPTHVLVNIDENRLETVQAIEAWPATERPQVVVTHPGGPEDVPALIETLARRLADGPGLSPTQRQTVLQRAARLRGEVEAELALTTPDSVHPERVLYLIWRQPWMTVARDTYLSRMLARVGWATWPDTLGGPQGAARYPVVQGGEPWLAEVDRVLLSSEPYAFGPAHFAEAQALCPRARVALVDGEALSWYGPRTVSGLRLLRQLRAGATVADAA
jgi:ABC-type hemin transport system substrate-binding protein